MNDSSLIAGEVRRLVVTIVSDCERTEFNPGRVHPEKLGVDTQVDGAVRRNPPEKIAVVVGTEIPQGMDPAQDSTAGRKTYIFFSENRPVGAVFASDEVFGGVNLVRKRGAVRSLKQCAGKDHQLTYRLLVAKLHVGEIDRPAKDEIFTAVGEHAVRGRPGGGALLQCRTQTRNVIAKSAGEVADFPGVLLDHAQWLAIGWIMQFSQRRNERNGEHTNHDQDQRDDR